MSVPASSAGHVPALSPIWEAAIPDDVPAFGTEDVPALAQTDVPAFRAADTGTSDWRIEVTRKGKYWQWRIGRAQKRQSRYGGKFELLSKERKAEYHDNQAKRQERTSIDARR